MTSAEPDGIPVTLEQILACREKRMHRQQAVLARHNLPVISLTIVMPGAIKNTKISRYLFDLALSNLDTLCNRLNWRIAERSRKLDATGPEAILAVDAPDEEVKRRLVELEDGHPLGRLWDFDVLSQQDGRPLSRSQFGMSCRKCLICDEPAFACGRSQRHTAEALQCAIRDRIHAFLCN